MTNKLRSDTSWYHEWSCPGCGPRGRHIGKRAPWLDDLDASDTARLIDLPRDERFRMYGIDDDDGTIALLRRRLPRYSEYHGRVIPAEMVQEAYAVGVLQRRWREATLKERGLDISQRPDHTAPMARGYSGATP